MGYPSSVQTFTTRNSGDTIQAAHVNDLQTEVNAVEGGLINGIAHDLLPLSNNTYDLGSSAKVYAEGHFTKVFTTGLDFASSSELTVATGAVTVSQTYHSVDTEADAASDDLDTLTATNVSQGFVVVLRAENVARVVSVKDGTGNMLLSGDCRLDATDKTITLIYDGTNWRELARSHHPRVVVLDRKNTLTEVVSTVTETAVYSYSVPANTLGTTRGLRLTLTGDFLQNNVGAQNLTVAVKYGATTILTTGVKSFDALANRRGVDLQATLIARNATNAQIASGVLFIGEGSSATNAGTMLTPITYLTGTHVSVAEDSTAAATLQVTITHGASSANESFRIYGGMLELFE